jgi:hypothetical protein
MPASEHQLTINDLPNEVITYILDFLPWRDLSATRLVSQKFKQLSDCHPMWKSALTLYFPHWRLQSTQVFIDISSYKSIFIELYQAFFAGLTPEVQNFFEAVLSNNYQAVDTMLTAHPQLIRAQSAHGRTVSYYASAYNRKGLLNIIFSHQSLIYRADLDANLLLGLLEARNFEGFLSVDNITRQALEPLYPNPTVAFDSLPQLYVSFMGWENTLAFRRTLQ